MTRAAPSVDGIDMVVVDDGMMRARTPRDTRDATR